MTSQSGQYKSDVSLLSGNQFDGATTLPLFPNHAAHHEKLELAIIKSVPVSYTHLTLPTTG